ncbi:protein yellow-like [Agrilus planipennis]|uniref:Protein yellow-like n=1 Tax=Agrilus planipennis TaxID=224129 RepID=A0A1W4XEE6_AGRPL|nr:protein yellow-like [Agrilus planipennis]
MRKMSDFGFCGLLGFLFVSYCSSSPKKVNNKLIIDFEWSFINFTWPSAEDYHKSLFAKRYIPENNMISNVKIYDGFMYLSLPRMKNGTPVTLAYIPITNRSDKQEELLVPYPNWDMNVKIGNCTTLQNVRGIEIDKFGVMWVLDGVRVNDLTDCPSKLVLLDLNNFGSVMDSFEFPESICPKKGCFLYSLVVDDRDGGYAYITDHSLIDPGIIVYSRHKNRAWKLRDRSMFSEVKDNLIVDDVTVTNMAPVAGIALSPTPRFAKQDKSVYYSSLSGYNIYSLSAKILMNEDYCKSGKWRQDVTLVGKKESQGDGMIMDHKGNLFLSYLAKHSICKWNTKKKLNDDINVVAKDANMLSWPDGFSFDSDGNLYVAVVGGNKYYSASNYIGTKYKILKLRTRTKSYIYS